MRSRVLMAPMEKNLSTADRVVTQAYSDYLVERPQRGRPARVEATYVDRVGKGRPFQLGAHADHVLQELADVHRAGGLISLELAHCGRQSSSDISDFRPVAPSPVPCAASGGWLPRELTVTEIAEIVERFAAAAARIEKGGSSRTTHDYTTSSLPPVPKPRSTRSATAFRRESSRTRSSMPRAWRSIPHVP